MPDDATLDPGLFPTPEPALGTDAPQAAGAGASDSPPKRRPGRPRKDGKPPGSAKDKAPNRGAGGKFVGGRPPKLEKQLQTFLATIGVAVVLRDEVCGTAILEGTENLARALDHLAAENPSVRRVLENLLSVSAWGEVIAATAAIALPVAAHHGLLPAGAKDLADVITGEAPLPTPAANGAAAA